MTPSQAQGRTAHMAAEGSQAWPRPHLAPALQPALAGL